MKKRLLFILCLFFVAATAAHAQTKTVSNADLEKFRQKRLAAEREYRENYARLGFPSPEQLEKQREDDRRNLSELSARLIKENTEREQRRREQEEREYRNAQYNALLFGIANRGYSQGYNQGSYIGGGFYPAGFYGARRYYGYPNRFYRGNSWQPGGIFQNPYSPFSGFGASRGNGVRVTITGSFGGGRR